MINTDDGTFTILPSHINIRFCIKSKSSPHSLHKKNTGPNDAYINSKMTMIMDFITKKNQCHALFYRDYTDQTNFIFEETSR